MCLKVILSVWDMFVLSVIILLLDFSKSQNVLMTTDSPEISTMIKVSRIQSILNQGTPGQQTETGTRCSSVSDFEIRTVQCLKDVHGEKWILNIFKYKQDNSMFMELLKQIICSHYKEALQCVHEIWTSCKNEETTVVVQDYLSQQVALQYNALCDINQPGNHGNNSEQTQQQQQQHKDDEVHKPMTVRFTEKLTYKWETEMTIPAEGLNDNTVTDEDLQKPDVDNDINLLQKLNDWKTNIGKVSKDKHLNNGKISESLKYVKTKSRKIDNLKYISELQYRLSKKRVSSNHVYEGSQ